MGKRKQKASIEIKHKAQFKVASNDPPNVINELLLDQIDKLTGVRTQAHMSSMMLEEHKKNVST